MVEEVTDEKTIIDKAVRKQPQAYDAPKLLKEAKAVKLADNTAILQDVIDAPPENWILARRIEYLDWTEKVVAGCRETNAR